MWGLFNESMVKVADDVLSGRGDELVAVGKARDAISKPYRYANASNRDYRSAA